MTVSHNPSCKTSLKNHNTGFATQKRLFCAEKVGVAIAPITGESTKCSQDPSKLERYRQESMLEVCVMDKKSSMSFVQSNDNFCACVVQLPIPSLHHSDEPAFRRLIKCGLRSGQLCSYYSEGGNSCSVIISINHTAALEAFSTNIHIKSRHPTSPEFIKHQHQIMIELESSRRVQVTLKIAENKAN